MLPFNRSLLFDMLSYCRPMDSPAECAFIARYVSSLPNVSQDQSGNYHVIIGESPVIWSCHTDTVHVHSGYQTIHYNASTDIVGLSRRSKAFSACLGADDTAGVCLMRLMILSGVPGHYIFHYGEERGGLGSSSLATIEPNLLDGASCAIALDRRGTADVITHQWSRCCSDTFADSLAAELNKGGLAYVPSDRGIFTDTANYTDLVPECTNLSVGYAHEHSTQETLDVAHLERLYYALCNLDQSALVFERLAGESDNDQWPLWYRWAQDDNMKQDLLPIVIDRSIGSPDWYCNYCGLTYVPQLSNADEAWDYCSRACEHEDEQHNRKAAQQQSMYLDPAFEKVQFALRRTH